jgi:hypothetical protein
MKKKHFSFLKRKIMGGGVEHVPEIDGWVVHWLLARAI